MVVLNVHPGDNSCCTLVDFIKSFSSKMCMGFGCIYRGVVATLDSGRPLNVPGSMSLCSSQDTHGSCTFGCQIVGIWCLFFVMCCCWCL